MLDVTNFSEGIIHKTQRLIIRSQETVRRSQETLRLSREAQSDRERQSRRVKEEAPAPRGEFLDLVKALVAARD